MKFLEVLGFSFWRRSMSFRFTVAYFRWWGRWVGLAINTFTITFRNYTGPRPGLSPPGVRQDRTEDRHYPSRKLCFPSPLSSFTMSSLALVGGMGEEEEWGEGKGVGGGGQFGIAKRP